MAGSEADRLVLELRIHGVNNTPPTGILDLPEDQVELVAGDQLGSFWRPRRPGGTEPGRRGHVEPGILREAYSWGGMARNSVGGTAGWQRVLGLLARVGWTLLIPFGVVNVAYWARRLNGGAGTDPLSHPGAGPGPQPHPSGNQRPAVPSHERVWDGRGAGRVRLAGLLLSLLLTVTVAALSMDLVGVQCFASPGRLCTRLPTGVQAMGTWTVPVRLAVLSLVPVAVMMGLWALAARTRTNYDRVTRPGDTGPADGAALAQPDGPLLSTPGFWRHHVITSKTAHLHLAVAMMLVAATSARHGWFGVDPSCSAPDIGRGGGSCRIAPAGAFGWAEVAVLVAAVTVMVTAAVLMALGSHDAVDIPNPSSEVSRTGVRVTVIAATTVFLLQEGILLGWRGPTLTAPRLVGLSGVVDVLLCLLLGVSLSALFLRRDRSRGWLAVGLAVGVMLLASGLSSPWSDAARIGAVVSFVLLGLAALTGSASLACFRPRLDRHHQLEAWNGCGPGVMLLLASLIALLMSSVLVTWSGNVLNGGNSAASLATEPACQPHCTATGPAYLLLPQPFIWFGVGVIATVGGLLIVLLTAGVVVWFRRDPAIVYPPPLPTGQDSNAQYVRMAARARAVAQLLHRAEPLLGLVVLLGAPALFVSMLIALSWNPDQALTGLGRAASHALVFGMWASAAIGAILVACTIGGSALANKRPFGLLWDLICFLPRAGHPFGPPCYAERAVPEVVARCDDWLHQPSPSKRRVILSAHSLGAVIAVASILAINGDNALRLQVSRVSLLTYGCQLRAYFSRIFPELLGPDVLGTHPIRRAGLLDPNPVVETDGQPDPHPNPGCLTTILRGNDMCIRWRNLWRRTDYLGFPAFDGLAKDQKWLPNCVDRAAEEIDTTGYLPAVLSHSDYPRTVAYQTALRTLRSIG